MGVWLTVHMFSVMGGMLVLPECHVYMYCITSFYHCFHFQLPALWQVLGFILDYSEARERGHTPA